MAQTKCEWDLALVRRDGSGDDKGKQRAQRPGRQRKLVQTVQPGGMPCFIFVSLKHSVIIEDKFLIMK